MSGIDCIKKGSICEMTLLSDFSGWKMFSASLSRVCLPCAATCVQLNGTQRACCLLACCLFLICAQAPCRAVEVAGGLEGQWKFGMAKVDITPNEPLRLSGYAGREQSHSSVADPLHVRVISLVPDAEAVPDRLQKPLLLISIESIAVTSQMTGRIAESAESKYGIPRSHVVVSTTHSHTAPHLPGALDNLFKVASTDEQLEAAERYLQQVIVAVEKAMHQALNEMVQGARVSIGQTSAAFGVQRRVIRDGSWSGFGIQKDGLIDPRVRLMRITGADGSLLGVVYQYACHCTSLVPEFNQISGDWAGLSASRLEELFPGSVFLPVIGCGGDINPEPRGGYDAAVQSSLAMVDAVRKSLEASDFAPLPYPTQVQFGFAGLEPEQPTQQRLKELAESDDPNERKWAKTMQRTRLARGRLPESVPMPIHVWGFGNHLSWVFLGGEVVVDYQFAIEKELETRETWVAAYCNDVFGYVASEAHRSEGGYEVDYSMIYYLQPGRWKSGTQSTILTRVRDISRQARGDYEPLDAQAALKSMMVPEGYRVDLVASEPLIQDPVNIAFGLDGSVWVVEMSDYPIGNDQGGAIKVLRDTTGDGKLDQSVCFLDGLAYPTSVQPWRNGAIVIAAPNIFFAEDVDGDGKADRQEMLISGIGEVNPQHRASGFELGLDGRLHFAVGEGTRELVSHLTGETIGVRGHDVAWNPDTGELEVSINGKTQFVPARDAFGTWFGNHNTQPIFQFVFEANQLDGRSVDSGIVNHLLDPPEAPPVFPRSRTVDRFNDLYTRDRFTSACGSMIVRVPGLFPPGQTATSSNPVAMVCEPVHNLVARLQLQPDGSVFTAGRHPDDERYDFFASTDPWSRPVRVVNAPDGSLWVLDMYRQVIEHPQWIPTAWLERVNLRGGAGLGRIYRVYHQGMQPPALSDLSLANPLELLQSPVGTLRELATLAIVTDQIAGGDSRELQAGIRGLLTPNQLPEIAASGLGVLAGKGWLQQSDLTRVLRDFDDPQLIGWALKLTARFEQLEPTLQLALESLPERNLGASVDLQWILSSLRWKDLSLQSGLSTVLGRGQPDRWLSAALTLLDSPQTAAPVVQMLLRAADERSQSVTQLQEQVTTLRRLISRMSVSDQQALFQQRFGDGLAPQWSQSQGLLLASIGGDVQQGIPTEELQQVLRSSVQALLSPEQSLQIREGLSLLLGNQLFSPEQELELASTLIEQGDPSAALAVDRCRYILSDQLASVMLSAWSRLNHQNQAVLAGTLMARPAWREALVVALEEGTVQANQLPPSVVQTLIGHYDRNLRSRAVAVFGRPSPRQHVVSDYLSRMPNPATHGDATRGEQWYLQQCAVCHQGQAGKTAIGPALENLTHWNNEQWITAVLDPSSAVEEKYKQTVILTSDQEVMSGIVVEETSNYLKVAGNDGLVREIAIADIEDRKRSNVSLMPDGFESKLTPEQLADLVHYLRVK
jgi:putative membrane-bound dehydrogenase-like protein